METLADRVERARKGAPKKPPPRANKLSDDEIRLLAYHLYERRCESGTLGDAVGDWFQAERLLSRSEPAADGN